MSRSALQKCSFHYDRKPGILIKPRGRSGKDCYTRIGKYWGGANAVHNLETAQDFRHSGLRPDMEDVLRVPVDLATNDFSDHEFLNMIAKDEAPYQTFCLCKTKLLRYNLDRNFERRRVKQ